MLAEGQWQEGFSAGRICEQKPEWCEEISYMMTWGTEFQPKKHQV